MARIETYDFDGSITVNDFVIGSDGDNANATRNYSLLGMLDYLGTQYNLQSFDLLYDYNAVDSTLVSTAEISSNNFADSTINMSDVTQLYVSVVTKFNQLVDEYLQVIGDNTLSIMIADMADYNNFGIFDITATTDISSSIKQLAVTARVTNGTLASGRSIGLKVGIGGGTVDLSDYVTLSTTQTISGTKTFSSNTTFNGFILADGGMEFSASNAALNVISMFPRNSTPSGSDNGGAAGQFYLNSSDNWSFLSTSTNSYGGFILDNSSLSQVRTFSFPDKDGTFAMLDDVGATSYTTTSSTPSLTVTSDTLFGTSPTTINVEGVDDGTMFHFSGNIGSTTTVTTASATTYQFICSFTITGKAPQDTTALSVVVDDAFTNAFNSDSLFLARVIASGSDAVVTIYMKPTRLTGGSGTLGLITTVSGSWVLA